VLKYLNTISYPRATLIHRAEAQDRPAAADVLRELQLAVHAEAQDRPAAAADVQKRTLKK
jgi:hypothetical protein